MTDATAPWMGLDRDAPVHHVGYGKVEELIAILAARITASEFDAVVGISRSGIVPATMLSNRLGKELYLIRCQRHCDEISWMGTPPEGKSLLIVDDIVSRGETMRRACEHLNRSGYAVKSLSLFVDRTRAAFIPDFALDAPGFVRFAWDRRDTTPEARRAVAVQEMHPPLLENECFGVDMDGILLPDIRKAHYRKDLQLALKRRHASPPYSISHLPDIDWTRAHIVTGRPTLDFGPTREWLDANGFAMCPLYCRDQERHEHSVAGTIAHKVETLMKIGVSTFLESELIQATLIAKACPTVDVVWWGKEHRLSIGGVATVPFSVSKNGG
jgi:adenine/guanine phosphoribosyltransferase-like PRPP-binding protein